MSGSSWWIRGYAIVTVGLDGRRATDWDGEVYADLETARAQLEDATAAGFSVELVALVYLPPGLPERTAVDVGVSIRLPLAPDMIEVTMTTGPSELPAEPDVDR